MLMYAVDFSIKVVPGPAVEPGVQPNEMRHFWLSLWTGPSPQTTPVAPPPAPPPVATAWLPSPDLRHLEGPLNAIAWWVSQSSWV
jgi:hypothetical protein